MAGDPRVVKVDGFIEKQHQSVPANLKPDKVHLPHGFTVCIIGASQGIGEHIAYAFAHARATNIVIASRTIADLELVAGKIKRINQQVAVDVATCDVSLATSVQALASLVQTRFGRLDIVIPNAAYAPPISLRIDEAGPGGVKQAFDVNVMGTYHVAHCFIPLLLQSSNGAKGFIAIGSIAGCIRRGDIANTGYTISKMAQTRMVEYLSEQYGDEGLLALSLHPGAVLTKMAAGNTPDSFMPYLTDDVDLAGAVCVWIAKQTEQLRWLNGRLISATWDMDELVKRREDIEEKDLLKFAVVTT